MNLLPTGRRGAAPAALAVLLALLAPFLATAPVAAEPRVAAPAGTVVARHGQLSVQGSFLTDAGGQPVQLRGMSSHGLQYFPQFVNADSMRWLRDDWGISVFRAAMYTEGGGYIDDPEPVTAKMREAIDAAVELGVYVVVDWHVLYEGDPNAHRAEAIDFFSRMSAEYGDVPNVIWEIANEPNGDDVTWSEDVKPYAEAVIGAIRANDPDNPVIVGSSTWSQDIHLAAADPLGDENVLYALHFYSGTHGQYLRDRIDEVMGLGLAVFVSEWGVSEASGTGGVFVDETRQWIRFLNDRQIGWTNWNLSDKDETSAVLVPGASPTGGWAAEQLSPAGTLVRELVREQGGEPASYSGAQLARVTAAWVEDGRLRSNLRTKAERADQHPRSARGLLGAYQRAVDSAAASDLLSPARAEALSLLAGAARR